MEAALGQANEARIHILGEMNKVLSESRDELSDNAPAMVTLNVHPDKIRDIIGKGGATIRSIVEKPALKWTSMMTAVCASTQRMDLPRMQQ